MGNDILNHIGYGHMGLTAMILGLCLSCCESGERGGAGLSGFWRPRRFALERSTVLAAVQPRGLGCSGFAASGRRVSRTAPRLRAARRRHLCYPASCCLCGDGFTSAQNGTDVKRLLGSVGSL